MAEPKITEPSEDRVVKHKVFRYFLERADTIRPDQVVTVQRLAHHGEAVKLRPVDARRGDAAGAFYTEEEQAALAAAAEGVPAKEPAPTPRVDLTQLDEGEIIAWLQGQREGEHKPSIPQVLSAVQSVEDEEDRATIAEAVIAAEKACDHDTRNTLVDKLGSLTEED